MPTQVNLHVIILPYLTFKKQVEHKNSIAITSGKLPCWKLQVSTPASQSDYLDDSYKIRGRILPLSRIAFTGHHLLIKAQAHKLSSIARRTR